jgi:predicted extracellular nuclease
MFNSARGWLSILVLGCLAMLWSDATSAQSVLPIGTIQGTEDVSAYNGQYVSFRGVVTGQYEDVNTRGIIYYTIFVQQLPDEVDGDPATSDAIAVFLGRRRPYVDIGDQVLVSGRVTEFYGFTEIDDKDLFIAIERRGVDFAAAGNDRAAARYRRAGEIFRSVGGHARGVSGAGSRGRADP